MKKALLGVVAMLMLSGPAQAADTAQVAEMKAAVVQGPWIRFRFF
jgi:opacity protein-like surface antigen